MLLRDRVSKLAKKKGIPVYKLEKLIGVSNGSISKWNEVNPSWDKLQRIANVLGVSISEITEGIDVDSFTNERE